MSSSKITKQVLIVGGGTAGWLSACYLAKTLGSKHSDAVQVTLIESEDIGTIGVGEGTFPTMRSTLRTLGISETDFIRETNATFKQAIKFVNWQFNPGETLHRNDYYHLFDVPRGAPAFDISPHWLNNYLAQGIDFDQAVSVQSSNCDFNLAPKKITTKEYEGLNYAYHLDAVKFARFLRNHGTKNLGVKHLTGTVNNVNLQADGAINNISSIEHGDLTADLFVDCTGFRSLLLGDALNVDFVSTQKYLFVDNAVTMQVPYPDKEHDIVSYTVSTAQEAGWTWDIGLKNRRGIGYVYSEEYTSHQRAEQVLREYVGAQADDLDVRQIPMTTGYRKKQWHKNCVAIGLSAGFLEPLESTAIAMTELAARFLCEEFPYTDEAMPAIADKFNDAFDYRWRAIVDFVKLHYLLTKRTDHPFWLDNANPDSAPASLLAKLKKWRLSPPTKNDFPSIYDLFGLESHQYVLYGMGFKPEVHLQRPSLSDNAQLSQQLLSSVSAQRTKLRAHFPNHRALIDSVTEHRFPKI